LRLVKTALNRIATINGAIDAIVTGTNGKLTVRTDLAKRVSAVHTDVCLTSIVGTSHAGARVRLVHAAKNAVAAVDCAAIRIIAVDIGVDRKAICRVARDVAASVRRRELLPSCVADIAIGATVRILTIRN